jgi:sRNA-binding regulator protein Hfq
MHIDQILMCLAGISLRDERSQGGVHSLIYREATKTVTPGSSVKIKTATT